MFRTELTLAPAAQQLSRTARVLTLGSCFADSIGARLVANKVETLANPFGTVFQPLMLGQLLRAAAGEDMDWQQHITEARGRWQSYDLHGSIGAASPVELLQHIQQLVQRTGDFVRQADVVVLTLGTAWAYRLRETGELVSNCHKQPADLFHKELLTPDEIINALAETHAYLRRINPKLQFVLTVSPVRHLKDTLPLNAVSKSVLRVACHYLSDLLPGVTYFPAYELLTDDLRDYRFYTSDMLHPSEVAEDYIWEKFARTYFDADFGRFRKEWAAVRQSLGHRPLYEGAPEHRHFLEGTRERLRRLAEQQVEVGAELQGIEQRIAALPVPVVVVAPEVEDDGEERIDIGASAIVEANTPEAGSATELPTGTEGEEAVANAQSARLSPEEFRNQRNRDRNRRGHNDRRSRHEEAPEPEIQPELEVVAATPLLTAPIEAEDELEEVEWEDASDEAADALATSLAYQVLGLGTPGPAQTTAAAGADAGLEPQEGGAKKKKRRSRGGAKRTARKHAARLAAEGYTAEGDGATTNPAASNAEAAAAASIEPQPAVELSEAANTPSTSITLLPEIPAVTTPEPEVAPKWNSRGEGKKSTVIKKSTPVKRGGRRQLFNTPTADSALIADAASVVETPLPELPDLPTVSAEPEIPAIAASTGEVEAILTNAGAIAVEGTATAKRSRNRNRGKGNKPAPAAMKQEAIVEVTVPAAEVAPAIPVSSEPVTPASADTTVAALLAAVSSRRKGTKKPVSAAAKPEAAAEVATPEQAPQPIEVVTATVPVETPQAAAKPKAAARPSRNKAKTISIAAQEPVTAAPVAPPLPLAEPQPTPPRRSRAAKPAEVAPAEAPAAVAPPKAPAQAKPKAAAKKTVAPKNEEKPEPVRKPAKKS